MNAPVRVVDFAQTFAEILGVSTSGANNNAIASLLPNKTPSQKSLDEAAA